MQIFEKKLKPSWRLGSKIIILPILTWLLISILLRVFSNQIIFHPQISKKFNYHNIKSPYTTIFLKDGKINIETVFIRNKESKKLLIYFTGNSGRLDYIINSLSKEYNILSPAYPGFHKSFGKHSQEGVINTADIIFKYALDQKYKIEDIYVLGHSLGGFPALYSYYRYQPKKTIIVNSFDNIYNMCRQRYLIFCIFAHDIFNSKSLGNNQIYSSTIYQFHNRNDMVVPFSRGEALFSLIKSNNKKFFEISGNHAYFDVNYVLQKTDQ